MTEIHLTQSLLYETVVFKHHLFSRHVHRRQACTADSRPSHKFQALHRGLQILMGEEVYAAGIGEVVTNTTVLYNQAEFSH